MVRIRKAQRALGSWRYVFAVLMSAGSVALRVAASEQLQGYGFITIFPTLIVVALLLGWKAGAIGLVTGAAGIKFFFLPEVHSFVFAHRNDALAFGLFIVFGGIIVWAAAIFENLLDQLETSRDSAEREAARNTLLLAELKHRVGNILQLVIALLTVRGRTSESADARRVLKDTIDQIQLLARAQAAIYDSGGEDISALLHDLARSITQSSPHIRCAIEVTGGPIARDQVVPALLVANELVMNAVEHAFAGRDSGRIDLSLIVTAEDCVLTVSDDGTGLPAGFSPVEGPRNGLKIVAALARQMTASFDMQARDGGGSTARLVIPRASAQTRKG